MLERILKFQNESEKNYETDKTFKTTINYFFAFMLFMASTMYAGLSLPFRYLYKKVFGRTSPSEIIHLNATNIDQTLQKEKLVLIDFWAEWCGPCVMMNPGIEKFAVETENIQVAKVNADLNGDILKKYNIRGLPQFLLIKDGVEIKRHAGPMTMAELRRFCKP